MQQTPGRVVLRNEPGRECHVITRPQGPVKTSLPFHGGQRCPERSHKIRLRVGRGGGVQCDVSELDADKAGFGKVVLAKNPVDPREVFLYHKTTDRKIYEEALKMCPGADDVLLFNREGYVTESTRANLVVERHRTWVTPPGDLLQESPRRKELYKEYSWR